MLEPKVLRASNLQKKGALGAMNFGEFWGLELDVGSNPACRNCQQNSSKLRVVNDLIGVRASIEELFIRLATAQDALDLFLRKGLDHISHASLSHK